MSKIQLEKTEIDNEILIEQAFGMVLEGEINISLPDDTEDYVRENLMEMKNEVNKIQPSNVGYLVMGEFEARTQTDTLNALPGTHRFDPPMAPPEPVYDYIDVRFCIMVNMKKNNGLGGASAEIHRY